MIKKCDHESEDRQTDTCRDSDKPHHTTTVLRPFFRDEPGEPVPEENFWTLWCNGRLTEADTLTIQLGATPSGLTSAHLHHLPIFLRARWPSCCPTNSVKALKAVTNWIYNLSHTICYSYGADDNNNKNN